MLERVTIRREQDVTTAVVVVQAHARALGFSADATQRLGTAVSELTRNICKYCSDCGGDVLIQEEPGDRGPTRLVVHVRDNGPGIVDLDQALRDHYSSSGSLGLGLPGVRRIVDAFSIVSEPGCGTVVTIVMELP